MPQAGRLAELEEDPKEKAKLQACATQCRLGLAMLLTLQQSLQQAMCRDTAPGT